MRLCGLAVTSSAAARVSPRNRDHKKQLEFNVGVERSQGHWYPSYYPLFFYVFARNTAHTHPYFEFKKRNFHPRTVLACNHQSFNAQLVTTTYDKHACVCI